MLQGCAHHLAHAQQLYPCYTPGSICSVAKTKQQQQLIRVRRLLTKHLHLKQAWCAVHVCRFRTLLRFSWHAVLVNMVSCLVLALTAQRAAAAVSKAALLAVPVEVLQEQPARYALTAPTVPASTLLAVPGNVSAVVLRGSIESIAEAADAAAADTKAAMLGDSPAAAVGLLASLPAWLLPMAWLVVTHFAVARNSARLEQLSTTTVPLALLLPVSLQERTDGRIWGASCPAISSTHVPMHARNNMRSEHVVDTQQPLPVNVIGF
jgi:hypothetical protein